MTEDVDVALEPGDFAHIVQTLAEFFIPTGVELRHDRSKTFVLSTLGIFRTPAHAEEMVFFQWAQA